MVEICLRFVGLSIIYAGSGAQGLRTWNARVTKERRSVMIKVKARGNESIEQMIRRFKKICEKEGLTKDIKRRSYYEKPSERRRRDRRKMAKRSVTAR